MRTLCVSKVLKVLRRADQNEAPTRPASDRRNTFAKIVIPREISPKHIGTPIISWVDLHTFSTYRPSPCRSPPPGLTSPLPERHLAPLAKFRGRSHPGWARRRKSVSTIQANAKFVEDVDV